MKEDKMRALFDALVLYDWGQAWEMCQAERFIPGQQPEAYLVKAMLTAAYWLDHQGALEMLKPVRRIGLSTYASFALAYTLLTCGQFQAFETLHKAAAYRKNAKLMRWMEIEVSGRKLELKKQTKILAQALNQSHQLDPALVVGFLQSNEHRRQKPDVLQKALMPVLSAILGQGEHLSDALIARTNPSLLFKDYPSPKKLHPVVNYYYARYLFEQGELTRTLAVYDYLMNTSKLDFAALQTYFILGLSIPQGFAQFPMRYQVTTATLPQSLKFKGYFATFALIYAWLKADYPQAYRLVEHFIDFLKVEPVPALRNIQIFFSYVSSLCLQHEANPALYRPVSGIDYSEVMVALGESHSLTLSHTYFKHQQKGCKGVSAFVMGVKMHHLAHPERFYQAHCVKAHLLTLKGKHIHLLLTIGEIDSRPDEGIWKNSFRKNIDFKSVVDQTVQGYIEFVKNNIAVEGFKSMTLQGIPAPNYAFKDDKDPGDANLFLSMIRYLNQTLCQAAIGAGFNFLDVYRATANEQGRSNQQWHLDDYHLKPAFYQQADVYLITPSCCDDSLKDKENVWLTGVS